MKQQYLLSLCLLTILEGCSYRNTDPGCCGETTPAQSEMWDPSEDEWYCPRHTENLDFDLSDGCKEFSLAEMLDIALSNNNDIKTAWLRARAQAYEVSASKNAYWPKIAGTVSWEWNDRQHGRGPRPPATFPRQKGGVDPSTLENVPNPDVDPVLNEIILENEEALAEDEAEMEDECECTPNVFVNPPKPGAPARAGVYNASISLSYLLFDFGGRQASVESARQALLSLNWSQNRKIQDIMFAVIQSYYHVSTTAELIKAKEQELITAKGNLARAKTLNTAGLANYLDVLQMETQVTQIELAIANLTAQGKTQLGTLAVALGMQANTRLKLMPLSGQLPVDDITAEVEELLEFAKHNRPDLAASYAKIIQSEMDTIVAQSQGLPTIRSSANFQQGKNSTPSGSSSRSYRGGITMDMPIFNGFMNVNKVLKAKENTAVAEANFERLLQTVALEVVTSYNTYTATKNSLVSAEAFYEQAKESYFYASQLYQAGSGTMMHLMKTQSTLADAEAKKIQAKSEWAIALYKVFYMTGMLNPNDLHEGCEITENCEKNEELTNESIYVE